MEPSATEDLFSGGESDIQRIKANGKCTGFFWRNPPNTNMLINGPIWAVFYLIPLQLKRKRNHMLEIVVKGKQDFRAIYFSQCLVEWFVVPPANTDQHKPRPKNPNQKHRERTLEEYMKLAAGSSSARCDDIVMDNELCIRNILQICWSNVKSKFVPWGKPLQE
ncbi:hypothetical protein Tco_0233698 [Tanacetum coccineum]